VVEQISKNHGSKLRNIWYHVMDIVQIHSDHCNGLLGTYKKVFKTNSLKQKFEKETCRITTFTSNKPKTQCSTQP
jgi:hypothetical protein